MRALWTILVGFQVLLLAACGSSTTLKGTGGGGGGSGEKLKGPIVGKWEGTDESKNKVVYDFAKDGTYTYEALNLKYTGKYNVVDDSNIELVWELTEEQLAAAKKVWEAGKEAFEKIPKVPGIDKYDVPEPQKTNKLKVNAAVSGDELTLGKLKLKKSK